MRSNALSSVANTADLMAREPPVGEVPGCRSEDVASKRHAATSVESSTPGGSNNLSKTDKAVRIALVRRQTQLARDGIDRRPVRSLPAM
jgi:hypothetical protein